MRMCVKIYVHIPIYTYTYIYINKYIYNTTSSGDAGMTLTSVARFPTVRMMWFRVPESIVRCRLMYASSSMCNIVNV